MLRRFLALMRTSRLMQIGAAIAILGLAAYLVGLLTPLDSGVPQAPGRRYD